VFQFAAGRAGGLIRTAIGLLTLGTCVDPLLAKPINVSIDAGALSEPVTRYEYGMFIEPIGALIARSLWAEMLDDRKFYYPVVAQGKDPPVPQSVEGRPGVQYRKWRPIGGDDAVVMDSTDLGPRAGESPLGGGPGARGRLAKLSV
jgi:alpha-N-arabinofuranosidase